MRAILSMLASWKEGQSPRQEINLLQVLPPDPVLSMDDSVRETPQRVGQHIQIPAREPMLEQRRDAFRQIECIAGEDDVEFDLVVEIRFCRQSVDVVIHQPLGEFTRGHRSARTN